MLAKPNVYETEVGKRRTGKRKNHEKNMLREAIKARIKGARQVWSELVRAGGGGDAA